MQELYACRNACFRVRTISRSELYALTLVLCEATRRQHALAHQTTTIVFRMSIKERLTQDLKTAMRAKDQVQLRTIRMLRAALQTREIELRKGDEVTLTEEQEIAVLQKQAKQRRDAIEQYEAADRPDLAEKEAEELSLIEGYLPQPFTDEELDALVKDVIAQTGAESMRDMGKVMGGIMPRLAGRADGRRVQLAVKSQLR